MSLLSNESTSTPASRFSDGVEFEETFPEPVPASASEPAPASPPRLTVVRSASEPPPTAVEPEAAPAPRSAAPAADASERVYQEQLERRLREAEEAVTRAIERMRVDEERRLVEWVRERREEEERRIAAWAEERRIALERSLQQRTTNDEGLARRLEDMLVEWESRFEQRLEQRRVDDERIAERRRVTDAERLSAWRAELEQALADRFSQRHLVDRAPLPDRNGELRSPARDALASARTARDAGRIMRDVLTEIARTAAFAVALHHTERDEVAYRYRVAADDDLGALLRHDTLDDGPDSPAAHMDGWVRAHRVVRVGARNATVHTAQLAIRDGEATIGVMTLQTEGDPIVDALLARIADLVGLGAPRLAELRAAGSFRGA